MTLITWVAVEIADAEFGYAIGISDYSMYAISDRYRSMYGWWWAGPLIAFLWAILLMVFRRCRLLTLVLYIQFVLSFVLLWFCFAAFVFYINNQSFWGLRRTIVGHEVYADAGLAADNGHFIPHADRLIPGELYRSKWRTVGGLSVMRDIAGTSPTLDTPDGESPRIHSEENGHDSDRKAQENRSR
jgi:hypothetical protein